MKKAIKRAVLGVTCASMICAVVAGTGCQNAVDRETRPVALAIGALDQNFNPFFYTSANDGDVISMTQIAMLNSNEKGAIVCGEDQATMALDYTITSYNANDQVATGDAIDHTTYEFVIKNGIKDSMGYDMGILDVLFNLYVYLDPLYTGSSTIYSTKIKGLASYRAQQPGVDDDYDYEAEFTGIASDKFDRLLRYDDSTIPTQSRPSFDDVKEDIQELAKLFKEELNSDWNSIVGSIDSYKEYRFTKDYEIYLFTQGLVSYQRHYVENEDGAQILERYKDGDGKFYSTLDDEQDGAYGYTSSQKYAEQIKTYMSEGKTEQEAAVDYLFQTYFTEVNGVYNTNPGMLTEILTQRSSGNELMQSFINKAISDKYKGTSDLTVKDISGITTRKASSFNGKNLGAEHDILSITINGVDPAAIYNFAFTVAPMHYYSNSELVAKAQANWQDPTQSNRFGVLFSDETFMKTVVGNSDKTLAPVGAGAYKMREGSEFFNGSIVEYERNTNFTTLGSAIDNAKIKYLRYVYTTDNQIVNSLKEGTIDYGTPNCTPDNIDAFRGQSDLNAKNYQANGFGYVGINPTYVQDREVRLAIMLAMNPQKYIIGGYYTKDYSETLYRPTSKTNFLNSKDTTGALKSYYTSEYGSLSGITYDYTADDSVITSLVESAGWSIGSDGLYHKGDKTLKYTFTIAGDTTDHPAWQMFINAAEQLNNIGFDITVKNDSRALIKLATGKLDVWAAAWTTGIDPDMYQVYHKDSKAASTKNWGYDTIQNNQSLFDEENYILDQISENIDIARSNTNEEFRTTYYVKALNWLMELAVELPTYQRHDLAVYNKKIINPSSVNQEPTAMAGLLFKIWELDYN